MTHFGFLPNLGRKDPVNGHVPQRDSLAQAVAERLQEKWCLTATPLPDQGNVVPVDDLDEEERPSDAQVWSLDPPGLSVYRCGACGTDWLRPRRCCGVRAEKSLAGYYTAAVSADPVRTPEFSVIVLTKNKLGLTRVAIESLLQAVGKHSVEIVFVDCASTDGSLAYFQELGRKLPVQVLVTHPEERFVYSRNCNRGAAVARGRYLIFANNDIENRDPQLFARLGRALADPRVGVVGSLTTYDCSNDLQSRSSLPADYVWSIKPVMGFFWGCRAEVFAELGGMDETFTGYGCDEIDFEYRAVRRNYRIALVNSMVHHELHATYGGTVEPSLEQSIRRFNRKHGVDLRHNGQWYWPFLVYPYPRISVAIACRNHGRHLPRALDSVLEDYLPSGSRRQVVVVNDASTDETASVLELYRQRFPEEVTVVQRTRSHGPSASKNQGIDRCIGDYVALLDADDEFLPYKLSRSLEVIEERGADFLYHDFIYVTPEGAHVRREIGEWSPERWREGADLPPSTWVFRSGSVRFNERCLTSEDPEFLRRRWASLKTAYLPEALTRYYLNSGSLSSRAMCRVVTGQLKELPFTSMRRCSDL